MADPTPSAPINASPRAAEPSLSRAVTPSTSSSNPTTATPQRPTERGSVPPVEFRTDTEASPAPRGDTRRMWLKAVACLKESWLLRAQGECIFWLHEEKNRRR